jgi:hypothetical protein
MSLFVCQLGHLDTQYDKDFPDVTDWLPKTAVRKGNTSKFPRNVQEYFRDSASKRMLRGIVSWPIKEKITRRFTEVR